MIERRFAIHRLALAVMAFAAVATGCQNESYYCAADTGCYICDGVGCRAVPPPTRPTCHGDFECAAGQHCTSNLGCVDGCSTTDDCPMGTVCTAGMCVGPTEPPPVLDPGACSTSADCMDVSLECVNGLCARRSVSGCDDTHPCATGSTCVAGECRLDENVCHFDAECGADRVCVNQTCTVGCTSDANCATGSTCVDGFCRVTPPPVGECSTNEQCGAGRICVDTHCVTECTVGGSECAAGQYCDAGRCRVDDRTNPFCRVDADCMPGSVCRNGACRSPCSQSAECPRFDVSLTVCLDMVCATTNEATSDCRAASDCTTGQDCVDGVCH